MCVLFIRLRTGMMAVIWVVRSCGKCNKMVSFQMIEHLPHPLAHMTNWEREEEISFHCPDCGHRQHAMTPECPACGNTRTLPAFSGCSVHEVSFAMNGGQRREFYRMLLSDDEAGAFLTLPSNEAYDLLFSLWDRVIGMTIDAGKDYEGMGVEVTEIVADKDESGCHM